MNPLLCSINSIKRFLNSYMLVFHATSYYRWPKDTSDPKFYRTLHRTIFGQVWTKNVCARDRFRVQFSVGIGTFFGLVRTRLSDERASKQEGMGHTSPEKIAGRCNHSYPLKLNGRCKKLRDIRSCAVSKLLQFTLTNSNEYKNASHRPTILESYYDLSLHLSYPEMFASDALPLYWCIRGGLIIEN